MFGTSFSREEGWGARGGRTGWGVKIYKYYDHKIFAVIAPLSKAGHRIHYHFYWTSLLDVCSLILQPRHGFAQYRASISPLRYKEISNTVIESGWCVDQHSSAGPRSIPHSTAAQIYFKKRTRQICH